MCAAEGSACSPLATIGQGQSDRTKTNDANHRQQRGHFRDRHRDIANVVNLRAGLVARILGCFGRKFTARRQIRVRDSREYPSDCGPIRVLPVKVQVRLNKFGLSIGVTLPGVVPISAALNVQPAGWVFPPGTYPAKS